MGVKTVENSVLKENQSLPIQQTSRKRSIMEWVRFSLFLGLILFVIPNSIGITKVSGLSMYPTFEDGNIILEEKISKLFSSPELGDVIIINKDVQGYKIVKRVIGVEGDTIEIKNGIVLVNGEGLPEIMTEGTPNDMPITTVPKNHLFVMGDNRAPGESIDSRDPAVGPIAISNIDGQVLFSIKPFHAIPKPLNINE